MQDACDPATFNAVLGEGTCLRNGGVKFDDFIAQLTRLAFAGAWHFAPNNVNAKTGETFLVRNRGGEVHTFTEVEEFGGGIVPDLNALARVPTVAPECQALDADDFVAPGDTYREEIEEAGNEKYQCCIHPWMRLEVHVSAPQGHQ
jgi:plastocyanin